MEPWQRALYLQALGIDQWVPRSVPAVPEVAPQAVVTAPPVVRDAPAVEPPAPPPERQPPPAPAPIAIPAPPVTRAAPVAVAPPQRPAAAATPPPGASASAAQDDKAEAWESLRLEVLGCQRCPLHASRIQGVFGVGNRQAQILVVGEAPGADEDRKGEPFVGRAGQLLDAMLHAVGLSRDSNIYIANVLKSRPPNNRDPQPDEVAACLPYLKRQIALLNPKLMLAVGRIAAQNLLNTTEALGRLRGRVHHFGELNTPLIVTYHPAYLLRSPAEKRKAWEDLKFARRHFRQLVNGSINGHRS